MHMTMWLRIAQRLTTEYYESHKAGGTCTYTGTVSQASWHVTLDLSVFRMHAAQLSIDGIDR